METFFVSLGKFQNGKVKNNFQNICLQLKMIYLI